MGFQGSENQIQDCLLEAVMDVLDRLIRRDERWERTSQHIIGDECSRGSSGSATAACSWKQRFGLCIAGVDRR